MPIFQEIVTSAELPTFTATLKASELMALGYFLATACKDFTPGYDFDLSLCPNGEGQDAVLQPKSLALAQRIQRINALKVDPSDMALFLSGGNVFDSMLARNTSTHTHVARSKDHLRELIRNEMEKNGPACSLNHIDVSGVTDMEHLFNKSEFVGDISEWDVSNVVSMRVMFYSSKFKGDISKWNVARVNNMDFMFGKSRFDGDLSKWDTSSVATMCGMFESSKFKGDISKWDTHNVQQMDRMFKQSRFDGDISNWSVQAVTTFAEMFHQGVFKGDLSRWAIGPTAPIVSMLSHKYLTDCPQPCVYHWLTALDKPLGLSSIGTLDKRPEWKAHFEEIRSMTDAVGMARRDAAACMQQSWMERMHGIKVQHAALIPLPQLE